MTDDELRNRIAPGLIPSKGDQGGGLPSEEVVARFLSHCCSMCGEYEGESEGYQRLTDRMEAWEKQDTEVGGASL